MSGDAPAEAGCGWILPPGNAASDGKQEPECTSVEVEGEGDLDSIGQPAANVNVNVNVNATNPQQQQADFSQRPPSTISAASSDDQSDTFSSYDSRRSTVSSVDSDNNTSPQQHPLIRTRSNAKHFLAERQRRRAESVATASSAASNGDNEDGGSLTSSPLRRKRGASRKYQTANPQAALAATEPPHENLLTKMAFAEQQRWITVQQKTFTKWLNTKIEARGLAIEDLVKDLSDGVSRHREPHSTSHPLTNQLLALRSRLCLSIY